MQLGRNFILLSFLSTLVLSLVYAETVTEEALILNEELKFLEEAANNVTIPKSEAITQVSKKPSTPLSLENTYFGNTDEEPVRTRQAAPKRRRD